MDDATRNVVVTIDGGTGATQQRDRLDHVEGAADADVGRVVDDGATVRTVERLADTLATGAGSSIRRPLPAA
jgi:hypothetical protein